MPNIWGRGARPASIASGILMGSILLGGSARAEPPIRSPEDAACRLEARAKVFSAPNPGGLAIEDVGRQIYFACMKRISPASAQPVRRSGRQHRRRHRRH
jgi:hypothetical protein